jgi:tetratricopeptide (TPR) repeat protein
LIEDALYHPGSYRFSHALLRDVVYDQIPNLDRGRLHKRIGEALEALHVSDLDNCIAELAFHFSESACGGDAGKAIAYCIAAGEQAASRLAHENAPEHFRSALRLMDFQDVADPRKRCELLIQLGAAEMRIGEREAARQNLLHAANISRQIDAPELLARSALGLAPGFFTIEVGTYDPELESLLNEARSAMPKMQGDLLVQLTARLAMAAVWSNTTDSCDKLSSTALTLARDVQNPVTKAYALRARHGALWGPERFAERRQLISELGELSHTSGDAEIALMYRILNITALLESGEISAADREIRAYTKLAETLQLPHAKWYVSLFCAMRALLEGRYSDAALAAQHFLEIGNRVHDQNAPQSFGAHFFLQLWEQNKLNEISVLVEDFITKHPLIPAWKCAALFVHSEIRNPEAVPLFDEFSEFGFDSLPLNETWAIAIQMLSNACVNIGCDSSAHQLYDLSLAGKMHHTIVGYGVMSWGSRARELGNLASLMGRFEEAEEHFELAVTQNRKTGAAPWVAHSQFDYAKMLARQRDPAHTGRIRELVADAQQAANTLGMVRLKLQIGEFIKEL